MLDMNEKVYSRNDLKKFLEKIWDNTFDREVGMRLFLAQMAEGEGFKLDRRLKKYGERRGRNETAKS